jgi:hypothetical protein
MYSVSGSDTESLGESNFVASCLSHACLMILTNLDSKRDPESQHKDYCMPRSRHASDSYNAFLKAYHLEHILGENRSG